MYRPKKYIFSLRSFLVFQLVLLVFAFANSVDLSFDDPMGKRGIPLTFVSRYDRDAIKQKLARKLERNSPYDFDVRIRWVDSRPDDYQLSIWSFLIDLSVAVGVSGIIGFLSERFVFAKVRDGNTAERAV